MLARKDRRAELADAWLRATGLTVIVALGRSTEPPILPFFGDPAGVLKIIERRAGDSDGGSSLVLELWFLNASVAGRVYEEAFQGVSRSVIDGAGWLQVTPAAAKELVERAASALGIDIKSADEVAAQALAAADAVVAKSEEMRVSGELASMNAAYKAYRNGLNPDSGKPIDYQDWMHKVRLRTAASVGQKVRQTLKFSTA